VIGHVIGHSGQADRRIGGSGAGATMIVATRRKLGEARFFYGHLVNERRKTSMYDPAAFRYYFSAFIQAARSVTWTLGNEEPEKWEAWEPKWKAKRSKEERPILLEPNTDGGIGRFGVFALICSYVCEQQAQLLVGPFSRRTGLRKKYVGQMA
jgi:hypothetical protein